LSAVILVVTFNCAFCSDDDNIFVAATLYEIVVDSPAFIVAIFSVFDFVCVSILYVSTLDILVAVWINANPSGNVVVTFTFVAFSFPVFFTFISYWIYWPSCTFAPSVIFAPEFKFVKFISAFTSGISPVVTPTDLAIITFCFVPSCASLL